MSDRVVRAQTRLTNHEKEYVKKRTKMHQLGKLLPDEAVKIPKIGDWNLGKLKIEPDEKDLQILNKEVDTGPLSPRKNAPPISAIIDFNPKHPKSRRAKTRMDAPFKIRAPPPVTEPLYIAGQVPHYFSPGTTTSDISQIACAKVKSAPKPLPPLLEQTEAHPEDFFLPLELFDDSSYEQYPLSVLLENPDAFSKYHTTSTDIIWEKCKVVEYDQDSKLFTIEWEKNKKRKKVPRFNVRFAMEDEGKFNKRIEAAKRGCREYEMEYRMNARIDQMPTDKLPAIPEKKIQDIKRLAVEPLEKSNPKSLESLANEIKGEFKRLNNILDFAYNIELNPLIPNRDDFIKLIPQPAKTSFYGLVIPDDGTYKQMLESVIKKHTYSDLHIFECIQNMWKNILQYKEVTFLSGGYKELMSLEQFIALQYQMLAENGKVYRGTLQEVLESFCSNVISTFLNQHYNTINKEKIEKMINTAVRMTNSQIIIAAQKTLYQYLNIFQQHIDSTVELEPQFSLDLVFEEENGLAVIPKPASFKDQILSVLQQLESTLIDIPTLVITVFDCDISNMFFDNTVEEIHETQKMLEETLDLLFNKTSEFLDEYRSLEANISINTEQFVNDFDPDGKRPLEDYDKQLQDLKETYITLTQKVPPKKRIGPFEIQCANFKEIMSFHTLEIKQQLLKQIEHFAESEVKSLQSTFDEVMEKLKRVPTTPEELNELKEFSHQVIESKDERKESFKSIKNRYNFLEKYQFEISNDETGELYHVLSMPNKLNQMLDDTERTVQVERIRMIRELKNNQKDLEQETRDLAELVPEVIDNYTDLEDIIEAYDHVSEIDNKLAHLKALNKKYNSQEIIFGFDPTSCRTLTKLQEQFEPISMLWNLASEWSTTSTNWLESPFLLTKPEQMNIFIADCMKKIQKLKKGLTNYTTLLEKVLYPLADQINKFKRPLQLVGKLRHLGINTKHWKQISEVVGFDCIPTNDMTLQQFLDLDLGRWERKISEIAAVAMQEYSIESTLDKMDQELNKTQFITVPFRDSGQFIVVEIDDIISIIDDQIVTTQTLLSSQFTETVKRASEGLDFLRHCRKTIEEWMTCQRQWLYLQPIFSGTSIQKKLPKESLNWNRVDKMWAQQMTLTHNHPDFQIVMRRDKILETFQECNKLLEGISDGINSYLESKRHGFPRFFFLSNEELIAILSFTKDLTEIQKSFKKLFEYINTLTISENTIYEMCDDGYEVVPLTNPIETNTPEIEDWLNAFEDEMKATIKESIRESLSQYPKKKRDQWIQDYSSQTVLISNQILWTQQITTMIRTQKNKGLQSLHSKYLTQLNELTEMIKQPLSKSLRRIISSLIVLEVHNRDIINDMVESEVEEINDFKWLQQLRYYWEDETVIVRSINNSYEYSYEYAGNSTRLVITPLTVRCYQTLLAAFKQNLSGAPSGPAGTGKTETVRDCAKALGRPCVVYNCSEEVTPEQMSQFFAGLATSGSWSCFDEFNRINIEVLSVIAQQLRCIQDAIASAADTFVLDKRTLKLNPSAAVCITMNPGYAGRTELPDNLKTIFRPCAMMVPDFVYICEILLFSGGFQSASKLAVKLVAIFDLCRQQLSNARHYDWGMRTMKAILIIAGDRKIKEDNIDESLLLVQCIKSCIEPRLIEEDISLFSNIIKDVFPDVEISAREGDNLEKNIREAFTANGGNPKDAFINKCVDTYNTTLIRHGSMLVGKTMSGKSLCWKSLRDALNKMHENGESKSVVTKILNPKAVTISELYGLFDPTTTNWSDGIISNAIREFSMSNDEGFKWIIVDGPVDSLWIESMNSLLDDNKVLCLPNNERISLGNDVKLIFEVDDLSKASPATVSRCGMIYFDTSSVSWEDITSVWLNKYSDKYPLLCSLLKSLFPLYIPKLIQFVTQDAKQAIPMHPIILIKNMLTVIESFFSILRTSVIEQNNETDEVKEIDPLDHSLYYSKYNKNASKTFGYIEREKVTLIFERIFIFSCVWSFGASLEEDSRQAFDNFLKDIMQKFKCRYPFPQKFTCFDYYIDIGRFSWMVWCDGSNTKPINPEAPIEQQFVPTNQSVAPQFLARLMIKDHKHMLIEGKESSKTILLKVLFDSLEEKYDRRSVTLSNCSEASKIYSEMKSFMQKRHGAYGPLPDQEILIKIDNLGAPKPEEYGAQPPLEFLRYLIDYGGWYDTKKVEFQKVVDTTFFATMSEPSGGMFNIPERLMRHFYTICLPGIPKNSLFNIVLSLFNARAENYTSIVNNLIRPVCTATIDMFEIVSNQLLPVPSKPHYIFSLRNIIHVLKGIFNCPAHEVKADTDLMKLWYHEMSREFYDRFNTIDTRMWFKQTMDDIFSKDFHISLKTITNSPVRFNNFTNHEQTYVEFFNKPEELLEKCKGFLDEHNNTMAKPLDIVMFEEAVEHFSSISRVLSMKGGHMMLVGLKSSGRKSLARLAMFVANIELFEVNITREYTIDEWREAVKELLIQCGVDNKETCFMISDYQLVHSFQYEDISNLLVSSWIPNIFAVDEIEKIKQDIKNMSTTENDPWDEFLERIKDNLHIFLVFSPSGQKFSNAIHSFPALRNETVIDWFLPWSSNSLEAVASSQLANGDFNDETTKNAITNICVKIHKSVEVASAKYWAEKKRFTETTPSRFFELLRTFLARLEQQKEETNLKIKDLDAGIEKIETTRVQIEELSEKLDRDIPILKNKQKNVEDLIRNLQSKQAEVEVTRSKVREQNEKAEIEATMAEETNRVAQDKLNEATPILKGAQDAIDQIDRESLVNIKHMKKAHPALVETFEALCIMMGRQPRKVESDIPGVKKDDYWSEALTMINEVSFIKKIKSFDPESITKDIIKRIQPYIPKEKTKREEKLAAIKHGSSAIANIYFWLCSLYDFWHINLDIIPLRKEAEAAEAKYKEQLDTLNKHKAHLKEVEDQLTSLLDNVETEKRTVKELQDNVSLNQLKLSRAQKIMVGLDVELKRWSQEKSKLVLSSSSIIGDALLISACITYFGAFGPSQRAKLLEEWKMYLQTDGFSITTNFSISSILGNDARIRSWILMGLPNDQHSIENALIITSSQESYPLLIDPQFNGTKWLKLIEGDQMVNLSFDQPDFVPRLKTCITAGLHVLIENVGIEFDPIIEPILSREFINLEGVKKINVGGDLINVASSFRLFLSTKYPNPHYSPEICSMVSLINFTTTDIGLTDLLMNNLIEVEREDIDRKRISLMEANASNCAKMQEIEEEILQIVNNAGEDMLGDDNAINTLTNAQKISHQIETQMAASAKTEAQIQAVKHKFMPVAERASLLYFTAADFCTIDPMYQFSLMWFVDIFKTAIKTADHPQEIPLLIQSFHKAIALKFYQSVSFSLFSKHKLLFSFILTVRIMLSEEKITARELTFLLSPTPKKEKNKVKWLSEEKWELIAALPDIDPIFENIVESLVSNESEWRIYSELTTPETHKIPYSEKLSPFQQLIILRVFHLHRIREGIRKFITETLGPEFINPPPLNLKNVFQESSNETPLIFVVTPGIDPQDEIKAAAESLDALKRLKFYSLGRGRGDGAEALIKDCAESGYWVVLQNCHLSLSWMPKLENIIDDLNIATLNPHFRLFLVTMSTPQFPIGVLFRGTKLVYEIPKGIRENMIRSYTSINADEYNESSNVLEKKLAFQLTFFHAVVLERLQFSSLGWNIPYEFNPSDFNISRRQLTTFISEAGGDIAPYEALSYVIGELNYGGRVTDPWDRRLLLSLLSHYFSKESASNNEIFGPHFPIPNYEAPLQEIEDNITAWPLSTEGEDVGLSPNASTIIARNEAVSIFNSMIEIDPSLISSSTITNEEQLSLNLVESLIKQIPHQFNVYQFTKKFDQEDIVNTVLYHEIKLYNALLDIISNSLKELKSALNGQRLMNNDIEQIRRSIFGNRIPELWLEYSYPSVLTLREYMDNLNKRVDFLSKWVKGSRPHTFNLGAFFHPEEFLTANLQVYARKHNTPFDTLKWSTKILPIRTGDSIHDSPPDGIYIDSLNIEGAKWDIEEKKLVECGQTEIISKLPVVHLLPTTSEEDEGYVCPVYKTQKRGTAATELSNYIFSLRIPNDKETNNHWIQRSVAVIITVNK